MGVNSEPPAVSIGNVRTPVPEIICGVNEDKDKIRDNIKKISRGDSPKFILTKHNGRR